MSEVECKCDPLYKLMESCMIEILRQENRKYGEESFTFANLHEPINHNRLGTGLKLDEDCDVSAESNVNLLLSKFRERCIRAHSENISRNTSEESVSVAFTYQYFTRLRTLWRILLEENEGKILPLMGFNGWFSHAEEHLIFQDIRPRGNTEVVVESVNLPSGKYGTVKINLSVASVSQAIIKWILHRYPRPVVTSDCCRLEHCKVSIGATEFPESAGNIPITQYRKYLVARSLTIALGKSGYFVDPYQHYVLPNEPDFLRCVIVVSEGRDGTKRVQHIRTGLVRVGEMSGVESKTNQDMSAEYFHNLRLQSVKIMRESKFGREAVDSDVSLSWIISAANLTTATMNYDLLVKDASADIDLLACESKDSSFNNAGMLLIMYNYARILSILNKYSVMVAKNEYPTLPPIEVIGFDHRTSREEISLLQLIWQWPQIVEHTMDFLELRLDIPYLLKCIKELANRFNNFYTSHKVLVPPNAPHSFNKMFARIYLLQGIRLILEEFLEIMQVSFNCENIINFE